VTAPDGPLLVLAGAGSGKTRAIAHRIAYLIRERRVSPWTILALTFTNKAAGEMRHRVSTLVGKDAPDLWVLTFHALGLRLLRRFGTDLGLAAGFILHDEQDRRALIRRSVRELGLLEKHYPVWKVASAVSARKNAAFSSDSYQKWQSRSDRAVLDQIAEQYQSLLDEGGGLDFDDLLIRSVELLECSESARGFADRRFQNVLVDEYQDTNRVQYRMLRLLAPHGNLFVVGDEDQSIYNFRGADLRNILDFERDFPEANVVKLEDNYRSTAAILEAAGALIANNRERKGKRLIPQLEAGSRPRVYEAEDEGNEAGFVAGCIQALRSQNDSTGVAVLYRTNAQSRAFEEEFVSRGIPHLLVGGQRFYERKEIKDALAYLRLLLNPHDNVSFIRVVNVPGRGVGGASIALIQRAAAEKKTSLWDAAHTLVQEGSLSARAHKGLGSFQVLIEKLTPLKDQLPPAKLVNKTIEKSQLAAAFEKESPAGRQTRLENLSQLVVAATDYQARDDEISLAGFLDGVSLLTDLDNVKADAPCLLMTLHAAKGLEFDSVFLTGLEEGLFPHTLSLGNPRSVEEERRLCYVGMTRARSQLTLTYARSRRAALQQADRAPSRFLDEISAELLDWKREMRTARPQPAPRARSSPYKRGTLVRHPLFGEGTVVEADPSGRDEKVTVVFRSAGRKKLVPRFANLEILAGTGPRPHRPRW